MRQEFLSTLTKEKSCGKRHVLVKHHLGHLPAKVLNRMVIEAKLSIFSNTWTNFGLVVKTSDKIREGKMMCLPSVTKNNSLSVTSDFRNRNHPLD